MKTEVKERCVYLEVGCSSQHGFNRSHAVVIMMLGGQLLGAKTVRRHDLNR